MATLTYHQPVDSTLFQAFSSASYVITGISSSQVVAVAGSYSAVMSGFFSSGGYGQVSAITYSYGGQPYLTMSNINVSTSNPYGTSRTFDGNDRIVGSWGNDTFFATRGDDDYLGGTGRDTLVYDANRSYATVSASGTGYIVKAQFKTDTLNEVERLSFNDGVLALDVKAGETAGSVYRLYQAAFDRKPDTVGLKYWVNQADQGASLADVALGFVQSNEFRQLNPSGDTNAMLTNYYKNVLHRAPDATGMAYWSNAAANGMASHTILGAFAESNENLANTAAATKDGIWLG